LIVHELFTMAWFAFVGLAIAIGGMQFAIATRGVRWAKRQGSSAEMIVARAERRTAGLRLVTASAAMLIPFDSELTVRPLLLYPGLVAASAFAVDSALALRDHRRAIRAISSEEAGLTT
jgi:hypothetical protein